MSTTNDVIEITKLTGGYLVRKFSMSLGRSRDKPEEHAIEARLRVADAVLTWLGFDPRWIEKALGHPIQST